MKAAITGVGHYAPPAKLTNRDLERMVDTSDEWITTRTGIRERRILESGKASSHMAVKAGTAVLAQRGLAADELDAIIVATVTPDMMFPSTAALVQHELKAGNCWGFDLSGGCTGFIYALATGAQLIESGRQQRVLVIGVDKMSSIVDYTDRNTCVIFGDAAGAVLLEPSARPDIGIVDHYLRTDGSGGAHLYLAAGGSRRPATHETVAQRMHYVFQDGRAVFKQAITGMAEASQRLMEKHGLKGSDIQLFIPHQANRRIIDGVAKKLDIGDEKVVINIDRYGNTTAATIPLALSEAHAAGRINIGDWLMMAAFGAGFTWGSLLLRWAMAPPKA